MYGAVHLAQSPMLIGVLPRWCQIGVPYANTAMTYLLVVGGSLAFSELTLGKLRLYIRVLALVGMAIAVSAIVIFLITGSNNTLIAYNNVLSACVLLALTTLVSVPKLSSKYLALHDRGVLAVGTFVFAVEALYNNLSRPLGLRALPLIIDHLGFAILLFSFGYVALQTVLASERRLLAIESELAIARDIQASILPNGVPATSHLRVAAAYHPMTAVAGDFYDFVPVDKHRVGFLIADVSGHGVPAALIASMIKVAMQSVEACGRDPQAVLHGLNRALARQLRGQLVSAAYLWVDTEDGQALYSSAGHPPLLCWRDGKLERIESNGLLFGVGMESNHYPVRTLPIRPGDRFLLYTDGVIEPENAAGDSFGEARLEEVVRSNQRRSPAELSDELLVELRRWQPASVSQQDDITLIVIDVI
jgi:sigma-B regulation protein RsbU (phosphoserine phosphatase)